MLSAVTVWLSLAGKYVPQLEQCHAIPTLTKCEELQPLQVVGVPFVPPVVLTKVSVIRHSLVAGDSQFDLTFHHRPHLQS